MTPHRFPYHWSKKDGYPPSSNGLRVFSTFACGGGSTMGYKLAGYEVLGCLEIDPQIIAVYRSNHKPALSFCEDIRAFRKREDLPAELFDLDILDGSPPCSTFSTSGNRDKDWGKAKMFREGQAVQRLDDLFFEFIALAERLQPKVVVAENVKGMILGNAKGYVREIVREMDRAGYRTQVFLLNSASMGVPQKRERVFFVSIRKGIDVPHLKLDFEEPAITYGQIRQPGACGHRSFTDYDSAMWKARRLGEKDCGVVNQRLKGKPTAFNAKFIDDKDVCNTIASASGSKLICGAEQRFLSMGELMHAGAFPQDYDFGNADPKYLIGMSVPPVMVAQVATQVREQWLTPAQITHSHA